MVSPSGRSGFSFGESPRNDSPFERKSESYRDTSTTGQNALVLGNTNGSNNDENWNPLTRDSHGLRRRKQNEIPLSRKSVVPPPRSSYSLGGSGMDLVPVEPRKEYSSFGGSPSTASKPDYLPSDLTSPTQGQMVVSSSNSWTNAAPHGAPEDDHGGWVLVYGYSTAAQYDEILRVFGQFGVMVQHKGSCAPGRTNWVAVQYASRLEAEKALCHQHLPLADGVFCGVKKLDGNDPILLHTADTALSTLWSRNSGVPESKGTSSNARVGILEEKDVLLETDREQGDGNLPPRTIGICERFARWVLAIED